MRKKGQIWPWINVFRNSSQRKLCTWNLREGDIMSKGRWQAKEAIELYIRWAEANDIFPDIYGKRWREYQSWLIDQAQTQLRKLACREALLPDKSGISYDDMELYFRHRFPQKAERDEAAEKPLLGKTLFRAHKKGGALRFNHIFYLFRLARQTIVSDGCDIEELATEDISKNIKLLIETEEKNAGKWDRSSVRLEDWSMDALAYTQVLSKIAREAKGRPDKSYLQSAKDLLRCVETVLSQVSSVETGNVQKKDQFGLPGRGFSTTILNSAVTELSEILLSTMSTGNPRREAAYMMMRMQYFKENLKNPAYKAEVEQYLADSEGDSHTSEALFELDSDFDDAEDFSDEIEDYDDAYEADSLETELEWDRYKHHED